MGLPENSGLAGCSPGFEGYLNPESRNNDSPQTPEHSPTKAIALPAFGVQEGL